MGNDLTPGQRLGLDELAKAHPGRVFVAIFFCKDNHPKKIGVVTHPPSDYAETFTIDDFCRFVS